MTDENVKEAVGILEKKEECVTKKGDKYWKFVINGLTYSLFSDFEAGSKVSTNEKVKIVWTEKENPKNSESPYRNLSAIFPQSIDYQKDSDKIVAKVEHEVKSGTDAEEVKDSQELSTNESIVRQVLYKVAAEMLATSSTANEVNSYVIELERGFYKRGFNK